MDSGFTIVLNVLMECKICKFQIIREVLPFARNGFTLSTVHKRIGVSLL